MPGNSSAPARAPVIDTSRLPQQIDGLLGSSVEWLSTHWAKILIASVIGAGIVFVLHLARHVGERLCRYDKSGQGWTTIIGRAISRTSSFFMVMLAAKLVVGYAGAPAQVAETVNFVWTVAAVFQAAVWARELILGGIEHRTTDDTAALGTALGLIRVLVTVALFAIAAVVVLDNLGVNVTGLIAGLGVGGIAIGLAAQGIFADLFAALAIIFDRPFRRGDNVSYGTTSGSIESIGLKSTRIRAFTGEERIISNKNLLDKEITNHTVRSHRRGSFALGVTYQTPADTCERIPAMLQEIVEANDRQFVRAGFTGFGASSLDFEVVYDSEGPDFAAFYAGQTAVGLAILRRFNDEGIDIAYPTQTTFTAGPDGRLVLPYAEPQPVKEVE